MLKNFDAHLLDINIVKRAYPNELIFLYFLNHTQNRKFLRFKFSGRKVANPLQRNTENLVRFRHQAIHQTST
jgi:hypothetical protein